VIHPKLDASLPTPKDTIDEHFLLHGMVWYNDRRAGLASTCFRWTSPYGRHHRRLRSYLVSSVFAVWSPPLVSRF
jgi:hypothetical protein